MKYNPYSYSKLESYNSCPKKFEFSYIDGIKVPEGEHLIKGQFIHQQLEKFRNPDPIKERKFQLTLDEIQDYTEITARFLASEIGKEYFEGDCMGREVKLAFNDKFELSEFWDKGTVYRGSIDRMRRVNEETIDIIDW